MKPAVKGLTIEGNGVGAADPAISMLIGLENCRDVVTRHDTPGTLGRAV